MSVAPFPTPWTVQHEKYLGGTNDSHGNLVDVWASPVDHKVYGWSAPRSAERETAGVEAEVVLLQVFSPHFAVGPQDRMTVDGVSYEVVGYPEDYGHGPFGFDPGMIVNLTRRA
jgi:hypothetical protein